MIKHLISENLTPVDTAEAFEQSVRECYPETTQVAWMTLDTVTIAKNADPVSWSMAESEYVDNEVSEGILVSFDGGSTHFAVSDIEQFLDQEECKLEAAG